MVKLFIGTIIISILVIVGGVVYIAKNSQTKEAGVSVEIAEKPSISKPHQTTDPTASWKIYRNEKYGFEFKYPPTWDIVPPEKSDSEGEIEILEIWSRPNIYNEQAYHIFVSIRLSPVWVWDGETYDYEKLKFQGRQALKYRPDYISELAGDFEVRSNKGDKSLDFMMAQMKGLPEQLSKDALNDFDTIIQTIKLDESW